VLLLQDPTGFKQFFNADFILPLDGDGAVISASSSMALFLLKVISMANAPGAFVVFRAFATAVSICQCQINAALSEVSL
jgi:hypothetical protein